MAVLYGSTRGNGEKITASMAILKGLAEDGGLFGAGQYSGVRRAFERIAGKKLSGNRISGHEQTFDGFYRRRIEKLHQ